MSCIYCRIIAGEIPCNKLWEDERFIAFLDINPINEGHTLLVPKTHVDYIFDLPDDLFADLFENAKPLAAALKAAMHAKRVGMVVEGFGVPHVHLHLVPINGGHELNPTRAKPATPEQLSAASKKILEHL